MDKRLRLSIILVLVFECVSGISIFKDHVFYFGDNYGSTVYKKEGNIGLFQYTITDNLEIPYGKRVTYVKVTVNAMNAPLVGYDPVSQTVNIKYDFPAVPYSSYEILVKAI